MVDCVLVNSPDVLYSEHYLVHPRIPLGLLYIASYLRSHDVSVRIVDCHTRPYTPEQLSQIIEDDRPYLVGLNVATPNRRVVYELAKRVKEKAEPPVVIVGGPHVSCLPEDVLINAPHIDGVVMGEGEEVVLRVMQDVPKTKSFPGFCARSDVDDRSVMCLAPRIVSLDSLPTPAYDLIDVSRYMAVSPELYVAASRGCRYNCAFCCSPVLFRRQVVFRNHRSVVEEIVRLRLRYGIDIFYFYDDNVLSWPELGDFCKEMSNTGIRWTAQGIINDLELDVIPLLSSAGCYRLSFGLESGSFAMQKYIGKVIKPNVAQTIAELLQYGISSRAFFIVGFPNETIRQVADTAKYIRDLRASGLSDLAVFPARPYPGTRLFGDCLSIHGDSKLEDLLGFQYLEDYRNQRDPRIRLKLNRYNTIPSFQVNKYFDSFEIRKLIIALYEIFYNHTQFLGMSGDELGDYLLLKVRSP